ncbi:MAG: DUF4926 domain-containing protein [Anaerolineae bacterium]|nr:DUF4926 domain-containing protein [Anaerolineae bacterium]
MRTIQELESIVLTEDMPEHGLRAGDIGTVVLIHGEGEGYEVEDYRSFAIYHST